MQKERSTHKASPLPSSPWPKAMMDVYAQGLDAARAQVQRNCKILQDVGATMSSSGENVARTAGIATEGYVKLVASAAKLIASGQEASQAVIRGPVRELSQTEENAAQTFFENINAQMTWFNAAIADTASGIMESFLISSPKDDKDDIQSSTTEAVAPEQVH